MSEVNHKTVKLPVSFYKNGGFTEGEDLVVREAPVTIYLNGTEFVTLVCSPGELKELAVGFLCSEGVLMKRENLKSILINEEDKLIRVETAGDPALREKFLKRFITSSSGRGRVSFTFANDSSGVAPVESDIRVAPREIFNLTDQLEKLSQVFKATGGAHSAALCTRDSVVFFYEDIGRHNAVDKIFGRGFLDGIQYGDKILVFSGRISTEILIKVVKMGIPIIVSRSAPTELAVKLADQLGITVVGFAREGRLSLYTHRKRVAG